MNRGREALILVPGLGADERLWAPQVEALRGVADVRVALDHLAHDRFPAAAAAILAAAPPRFALAGTSMGGYVALEVVRQAAARVTRLALLNTSARADTPEQQAAREQLIALARSRGIDEAVRARLPLTVHPRRMDDAALIQVFYDATRAVGLEAYVRQMRGAIGRADSRALLATIACPTLVLGGRQDVLLPPALSEEIAALVPGARLVLLDDCGHCANLEQPAAVNAALLDWLAW